MSQADEPEVQPGAEGPLGGPGKYGGGGWLIWMDDGLKAEMFTSLKIVSKVKLNNNNIIII